MNFEKILRPVIAFLLPPISVFMERGVGRDLAINILLCFLLWLPASAHALWLLYGAKRKR